MTGFAHALDLECCLEMKQGIDNNKIEFLLTLHHL